MMNRPRLDRLFDKSQSDFFSPLLSNLDTRHHKEPVMTEAELQALNEMRARAQSIETETNAEAAMRQQLLTKIDELEAKLLAAESAGLVVAGNFEPPVGTPVAAGLLDRMKIVRWLLENVGDLQVLIGLYDLFQEAQTLADKWDIIKSVGDHIVAVIDTFPVGDNGLFSAASVYQSEPLDGVHPEGEDLAALAEAKAIDFGKIVEVAQFLIPVIAELLVKLRK